MYGVELLAVGRKRFHELCQQVSATLCNKRKHANAWIAANFLTAKPCDPELYAIQQAIRHARRFLQSASPGTSNTFLEIAACHSGTAMKACGPASVLKTYLNRIGCNISRSGDLLFAESSPLSLTLDPLPAIARRVQLEWGSNVLLELNTRDEWCRLPHVDCAATTSVMQKFPEGERRSLAWHMCGSFMSAVEKAQWQEGESGLCPMCQKCKDSLHHQLWVCPELANLRSEFQNTLDVVEESFPSWTHFPFIPAPPEAWFHAELVQARKPFRTDDLPELAPCPTARKMFYTDGSCLFPTDPYARAAAGAIVLDTSPTREHRHEQVRAYWRNGDMPQSLQCILCTEVYGEQSINRAELLMIVLRLELDAQAEVRTDSKYAVSSWNRVKHAGSTLTLSKLDNSDLLCRLWHVAQEGAQNVIHVKAHREPSRSMPADLVFDVLARPCAKTAARTSIRMYAESLTAQAAWRIGTQELFHEWCKFCVQVHRRMHAASKAAQLTRAPDSTPQRLCIQARMSNLHSGPAPPQVDLGAYEADAFLWGSGFGLALWKWWKAIIWPAHAEPGPDDPGVSYLELLFDFLLTTGQWIPLRTGIGADIRYHNPLHYPALQSAPRPFRSQTQALEACLRQLQTVMGRQIHPPCKKGPVRSLRVLGSTGRGQRGFVTRPQLRMQGHLVNIVRQYNTAKHPLCEADLRALFPAECLLFQSSDEGAESAKQARIRFRKYAKIVHRARF